MNFDLQAFQQQFGSRLALDANLARYTTARVGGNAAVLVQVETRQQLTDAVIYLAGNHVHYKVIGEGSNILFSDSGYDGVILVNRARQVTFTQEQNTWYANADSGANLVTLARKAADMELSGLEWACGIPGTVGGAVYGNAGAHGSDMQSNLESASILHPDGHIEDWPCSRLQYGYRTSIIKSSGLPVYLLSAKLRLIKADRESILSKMAEFTARRKASQPGGASLGSIFKNPAGDHAGRLIEAAGMKGFRVGGAAVSDKHANFFVNDAGAKADDIYRLIRLVQAEVAGRFGIELETEIELAGDFTLEQSNG